MHEKTTVLILLDAFRWDYLNQADTPVLWSMAQQGLHVQKLVPSFGFCERSEIFAGARPDVSGNFTAITYDPAHAPLAGTRSWLRLLSPLDKLLQGRYVRRALGAYLRLRGKNFPLYHIPLWMLPLFSLTEDSRDLDRPGGLAIESVLDVMAGEGKRFFYDSFTALGMRNGNDDARQQLVLQHADEGWDLYLLYIGATDSVVHQCGTQSPHRHRVCQELDRRIADIRQRFQAAYQSVNFLVLGDHGMVDVEHYVDVQKHIDQVRLVHGRDYVMFLDSTMARFWFLKPEARQPIEKVFRDFLAGHGQLLTSGLGQAYHVPAPGPRYGELIWWANAGTAIFPDYFHRSRAVRAMHGYCPEDDNSKGLLIVYSRDIVKRSVPQADLIDVCPTLCDLLQSRYPAHNAGVSLLGQTQKPALA